MGLFTSVKLVVSSLSSDAECWLDFILFKSLIITEHAFRWDACFALEL